jgi:hypothetical protein
VSRHGDDGTHGTGGVPTAGGTATAMGRGDAAVGAPTTGASWTREVEPAIPPLRRAAGVLVIAVTAATAAVFALGAWNPWQLVVLKQHFGNPWLGLLLLGVGIYAALWLLRPIRNEARQRGRLAARFAAAVLIVVGLVTTGLLHLLYRYDVVELAHSPDGRRTVALVTAGGHAEQRLLVYEGTGLATREVGSLGRPCARVEARFAGPDLVIVNQGFGDWEFPLDPANGEPRHRFGPRCSTGPIPATLEP